MSEGFRINKAYAEKYNTWRQKEELQKLKNRYGDEESEDSSSSESEDEDAEALTEQLEKDWLRTLSALKSKDPRIYQKDVKFYHDEENEDDDVAKQGKKTKDKPMYLKDYDRKVLLEKGGMISDEEEGDDEDRPSTSITSRPGYDQEQEALRKSVLAAAGDESSDSDDDGLLKRREKSAEEKQHEDDDYLEWLKGQKDTLDGGEEVGEELEPLKKYWQNKNLDEGEKFLKNYILNRQYIDKDERMPTYHEIVDDHFEQNFSDEEELLTRQATFERKYNFRFEEPDCAEIKTYPRNFEESVRRKDTKRTDKRKEVEERKKMEKEKKKDELKQLKKLKRQEILDKIEKLKEITGNKTLGIDEKELEDEFDPSKHDQMMQQCFDEQYYEEGEGEEEKPVFEMSDEDGEDWDGWHGEGDYDQGGQGFDDTNWNAEPGAEDPSFIMDADYDPVADIERKKKKKEKKKKNKLTQALATKKPVFDPNEKTFEEYFDEYYKLDFEDIIDDMPCRYKYRKVTPNTFGLTVDEILKCRDKELNAWVSVKRMSQYRTESEEQHDLRAYRSKGKSFRKKQNILPSLYEKEEKDDKEEQSLGASNTQGESKSKKKRKRKAKKKQMADALGSQSGDVTLETEHKGDTQETEQGDDSMNVSESDIDGVNGTVDDAENVEKNFDVQKHGKKRKADDVEDNDVNGEIQKQKSKKKKKRHNKADSEARNKEDIEASTDSNIDLEQKTHEHKDETNEKNLEESNAALSVENKDKEGNRKKKNKKKKKNREGQKYREGRKPQISEERLKAYGINPLKYKYMKKEDLIHNQT